MRIEFVAPPFAGHLNPMLPLARAARETGFEVAVISGARKTPLIAGLGLEAAAVSVEGLEGIANAPHRVGGDPARLYRQFQENLRVLPQIRRDLLDRWRRKRPDLVVADSVAPVAGFVCDELGIPWITTIATPFAIESRSGTPSYCGGWSPGNPVRDALGRAVISAVKRGFVRRFRKELAALGLRRLYRDDGTEAIYSARAILGFGLTELEFPRDWPLAFQMIGPVIDAPERGAPAAYEMPGPRVLVSLGTHLLWAKRDLVEQVGTLSRRWPRVSFVVSLGEPERAADAMERIGDRLWVAPMVPYRPGLGAFDAVIHHGGAGVTYASILYGLPSAVAPHDYDQFDFAARVAHHRLGCRVRSIGEAPVERLLDLANWPALPRFRSFAEAYRPVEAFLAAVRAIC